MVFLLGASGYIGQAFEAELRARGWPYTAVSRRTVDYTNYAKLVEALRACRPSFLVNCAGFTGKPNVDACESARAETLLGNTLLPQTISHACESAAVPWGHVSSGCVYSGGKIADDSGVFRPEKDLLKPAIRDLVAKHPDRLRGFNEEDPPNFTFRDGPCSFYSGSKALAEEALAGGGERYVWRLRIPFDERDNARNYLSKVQRYRKVYDNINSLSHRGEFARACLDLWSLRADYGVYNLTNPGHVSSRRVIDMIRERLKPDREFEFWENDEEFYRTAAKTPRSNCVMDPTKSLRAGARLRPVEEAIWDSLDHWRREGPVA